MLAQEILIAVDAGKKKQHQPHQQQQQQQQPHQQQQQQQQQHHHHQFFHVLYTVVCVIGPGGAVQNKGSTIFRRKT